MPCRCDQPLIRCGHRGCRCELCGEPDRLNLDFWPQRAPERLRATTAADRAIQTGTEIAERHLSGALPAVKAELARDIAENLQSAFNMQLTMERAEAPT